MKNLLINIKNKNPKNKVKFHNFLDELNQEQEED